MKLFFNSSMPRSGSTLLQNILAKDERFYVTPTSGLLELIYGARKNFTDCPEFKAQNPVLMKNAFLSFCKNGIEAYINSFDNSKQYFVDKSRGWGYNFFLLQEILGEKPKILMMVRDLRSILASMEKIYRKNQAYHQNINNPASMQGTNLTKRINAWLNSPPVGLALDRLKDIIQQDIAKHFKIIKYEDLLTSPQETMNDIYSYLDVTPYSFDFQNIPQVTKEDDEVYGVYGNHKIQNSLQPLKFDYQNILGKELCNELKNGGMKWYFDYLGY